MEILGKIKMTNNTKQKIREICIYHSDDGTSGFLLSEKQFEKLFDLVEGQKQEFKRVVEKVFNDSIDYSEIGNDDKCYFNEDKFKINFLKAIKDL